MKELLRACVVGLSVVLASFPLRAIAPDRALVWTLAIVAALAAAIVGRLIDGRRRSNRPDKD